MDTAGNALVVGMTWSDDWVSGGFDTSYNSGFGDAFVAKLSPSGSHLWSTYVGGPSEDPTSYEYGYGIAVDFDGNALVTGSTESPGWVSGGFDTTHNGKADAFVAKLSPIGDHLWSTFLGGSDSEYGRGIAVDSAGNALVTGTTYSSGWVSGGYDTSLSGDRDAFVAKLSPAGGYLWSTYLGGSDRENGNAIAVDTAGNALVTGYTTSDGWVSGGFDTSFNGGFGDAFVAKLSPGGSHIWSTYLGGDASENSIGTDYGKGIAVDNAVDNADNVLVTGVTTSPGWVSGGPDTTHDGRSDIFVARIISSPPQVSNDIYTTDVNLVLAPVAPGLLANDQKNDADALTAVKLTDPQHAVFFQLNADGSFVYVPQNDYQGSDSFTYKVTDGQLESNVATVTITVGDPPDIEIAGRHVLYNGSWFDGNSPAANAADDGAIATDKTALLPGQTATFANYTSFAGGINGLMVDVANLPPVVEPIDPADYFEFRVGNDDDPAGWSLLTATPTVTVRRSAGTGGSDRVTIVWDDGAIRNTWLEVTVKAANLGLTGDDVFYFGNAVAEAGNSDADAKVTVVDLLLARNNPRDFQAGAPVDFPYDYDRDGQVNATDVLLARNNRTSFLDELKLVDLSPPGESPAAAELAWLAELESTSQPDGPTEQDRAAEKAIDLLMTVHS